MLSNDADPDASDTFTLDAVSLASGLGTPSISGNQLIFDPAGLYETLANDESATATVDYTMSDPYGLTSTATVTITIVGSNDGPTATGNQLFVSEDGPTESINALTLGTPDSDPDTTDILSIIGTSQPPFGESGFTAATVSFDPLDDYHYLADGAEATTAFDYEIGDGHGGTSSATIDVTVRGINDAPVAVADSIAVDESAGATTVNLMTNDYDVDDGSSFSLVFVNSATIDGLLEIAGDAVTYDPQGAYDWLGYNESVLTTLSYGIVDEHGRSSVGVLAIVVNGVNTPPTTQGESVDVDEDGELVLDQLTDNDTDTDISDHLVVSAIDTSSTTGVATLDGGTVTYSPGPNYEQLAEGETAIDSLRYTVSDGNGGFTDATLTITVHGLNDGPTTADDTATTDEDTAIELVDLTANDTDIDNYATLEIIRIDQSATIGTAALVDGTVTYDPNAAFESLALGESAEDTLTYTVSDNAGVESTAVVTITVNGMNDAPGQIEQEVGARENEAITFSLQASQFLDVDESDTVDAIALDASVSIAQVEFDDSTDEVTYTNTTEFDYLAVGKQRRILS
ncbi:MAG: Ig-like domain-containing protein [Acidimicrobiales bacterium]